MLSLIVFQQTTVEVILCITKFIPKISPNIFTVKFIQQFFCVTMFCTIPRAGIFDFINDIFFCHDTNVIIIFHIKKRMTK